MSRVWEIGPNDKSEILVLLAIADFCNDDGECWPSVSGLARKARMTERGIQKIIVRLIQRGWLHVTPNAGRKGCNLYRVLTPNHVHPEQSSPRTREHVPPNRVPKTPEPRSPEPSIEPSIEPSHNTRARKSFSDEFEAWWSHYPKKTGKDVAYRSFQKAKKAVGVDILFSALDQQREQLERAANRPDGNFCPNPSTWLNQGRYHDEASAPSLSLTQRIARGETNLWNSDSENVLPLSQARLPRD
jgi:hypothetical protein